MKVAEGDELRRPLKRSPFQSPRSGLRSLETNEQLPLLTEQQVRTFGKKLSRMLRHSPGTYGVEMDSQGKVPVKDAAQALDLPLEALQEIVNRDCKGRFVVNGNYIYAAQGHSVPVNLDLKSVTEPLRLYHGTKASVLQKILEEGLTRRSRLFIYLSPSIESALAAAKRRPGQSVILEVDTQKFLEDGNLIYEAENGVYLADSVPANYLRVRGLSANS